MTCGIGIWIRESVSLSRYSPCILVGNYVLLRAVERTKTRPMANGDVSIPQAVGFLGLQLSLGLAVLTQLNWYR